MCGSATSKEIMLLIATMGHLVDVTSHLYTHREKDKRRKRVQRPKAKHFREQQ